MAGEEEQVPGGDDIPDEEKVVQGVVSSLQDLASFETQTLAAEVNILGLMRDRMCSAARHADPIQSGYRRVHYKTELEAEESVYLSEGFPFSETAKRLSGLLVVDNYSTVELEPSTEASHPRNGQYTGERLYLGADKKWILVDRTGGYSEAEDSTSEWTAHCSPIPNRQVLDRYSVEVVTSGLFAATNKVWERLSPRMEALKKRYEKVVEVSDMLAKFTGFPPEESIPAAPERKRKLTRR